MRYFHLFMLKNTKRHYLKKAFEQRTTFEGQLQNTVKIRNLRHKLFC